MDLFLRHLSNLEQMTLEQVVVHRLLDDLGNFRTDEFNESVVLCFAGPTVTAQTETRDGTELGEVLAHLGLVEPVRDASYVEHAWCFALFWVGSIISLMVSGNDH